MKRFLRCWWYAFRYCPVSKQLDWSSFDCGLIAVIAIGGTGAAWGFMDVVPRIPGDYLSHAPTMIVVLGSLLGFGALTLAIWGAVVALIAIRSFERWFGFLPPTTLEGRNALQYAVNQCVARKAMNLHLVYREEEGNSASFRALAQERGAEVDLVETNRRVQELESLQRVIERAKQRARREFYGARNAAGSKYLPWSFRVEKSYKDYIPEEATARR